MTTHEATDRMNTSDLRAWMQRYGVTYAELGAALRPLQPVPGRKGVSRNQINHLLQTDRLTANMTRRMRAAMETVERAKRQEAEKLLGLKEGR